MKLLIAFGTDDGKNLNNDHVGMAKYFTFTSSPMAKNGSSSGERMCASKGMRQ